MQEGFFEQAILNSPYDYPSRHWELDEEGQPTQTIIPKRRRAEFIYLPDFIVQVDIFLPTQLGHIVFKDQNMAGRKKKVAAIKQMETLVHADEIRKNLPSPMIAVAASKGDAE